jgi:hypothetical protein
MLYRSIFFISHHCAQSLVVRCAIQAFNELSRNDTKQYEIVRLL